MNNLKLAVRRLLGAPFVTGIAVVSLALGIGVNAALFTLFSTVLLRPLPVPDPETLVNLAAPGPKPGSQQCWRSGDCEAVFSYLMFRDLERDQTPFMGIAAHKLVSANLAFGGQTQSADAMLVSGSYFTVLGLQPALGRLIGNDDDKAVGQSPVAVISHAYWRTRFDASQNVINQTLVVNGQPMTIIGVTPPGFEGTTLGAEPKVYVPITLRGVMQPGSARSFELRQHYWVYLFARRKAGVTIDEARSSINVLYHNIVNNVEADLNRGLSEQTFARFLAKPILVEPGARGQSLMIRDTRQPMTLLMAVAGLVLVIACANIANLLLVRAAARASEMAVRLSLGANRSHLITQLLVESCLLAAIGGAAGLLVARWTLGAVSTLLPAQMAAIVPPGIDGRMLLTATVLSLGTGLLFGLFPALHASRPDLAPVLKGHSGQPSGAKTAKRFRLTLATAQIALSMALLVGAGLFTRSLYNVSRVELGVRTDKLVTFSVTPQMNGYSIERSRALFERLETDLSGLPGVTAVSASLVPTLSGVSWGTDVAVEGFKYGPDINSNSRYNAVGAGYFATMGMPLLAGREFTAADRLGAPQVAIVNESFTKKFNLGTNAVGKRMGSQRGGSSPLDTEIIAIVKDAKYAEVKGNVPCPVLRALSPGQHRRIADLLCQDIVRAGAAHCCRARRGRASRCQSAGGQSADDGAPGSGEHLHRSVADDPVGVIRRARDLARGRGPLRRAGVYRGAAHARDRIAPGTRRRACQRAQDDPPPGGAHDAHRRLHRLDRRTMDRVRREEPALSDGRPERRRLRGRSHPARLRRDYRRPRPGPSRVPRRSDDSAEIRVISAYAKASAGQALLRQASAGQAAFAKASAGQAAFANPAPWVVVRGSWSVARRASARQNCGFRATSDGPRTTAVCHPMPRRD